jgi:hypothetical protein
MSDYTNKPKDSPQQKLLSEDSSFLLQEDGYQILLEGDNSEFINKQKS